MSFLDFRLVAFPDGLWLPRDVRRHNIEQMARPPAAPRVVGPWHSASVHDDDCRCERCAHLGVNGHA